MNRAEGQRILQAYEEGHLSFTDRTALVDEVAIAILRAAIMSSTGSVTLRLFDGEGDGNTRKLEGPKR